MMKNVALTGVTGSLKDNFIPQYALVLSASLRTFVYTSVIFSGSSAANWTFFTFAHDRGMCHSHTVFALFH